MPLMYIYNKNKVVKITRYGCMGNQPVTQIQVEPYQGFPCEEEARMERQIENHFSHCIPFNLNSIPYHHTLTKNN